MQNRLYRKKSLEHINSPEELHDFLCVTSPRLWMILSAILVLLVGFLVYASAATMENAVPVPLTLKEYELPEKYGGGIHSIVYGELPRSYDNMFSPGMEVRMGDEKGVVSAVSEMGDGAISVVCRMENDHILLPDGEYDGEIIIEKITPISFLWQ